MAPVAACGRQVEQLFGIRTKLQFVQLPSRFRERSQQPLSFAFQTRTNYGRVNRSVKEILSDVSPNIITGFFFCQQDSQFNHCVAKSPFINRLARTNEALPERTGSGAKCRAQIIRLGREV